MVSDRWPRAATSNFELPLCATGCSRMTLVTIALRPLQTCDEIRADILAVEKEAEELLSNIIGGAL